MTVKRTLKTLAIASLFTFGAGTAMAAGANVENLADMSQSEMTLAKDVQQALDQSSYAVNHVNVEVDGKNVVLSGMVTDPQVEYQLVDIAKSVKGVGDVGNRMHATTAH